MVEKADHDGHHVSQRSDAKESIIGAGMRHKSGVLGGVPYARCTGPEPDPVRVTRSFSTLGAVFPTARLPDVRRV